MEEFFKAFKEYDELRKTIGSSDQHSFPLVQAKRDLEAALIQIIDTRIKAVMGRERRNTATTTKPSVELSAEAIGYIDALNSAPTPPNVDDLIINGDLTGWFENYFHWFAKAKKALR